MKTTLLKNIIFIPLLLCLTLFQLHAQTLPPKAWDKTFGGTSEDYLEHMVETPDGGFLLAGYSASNTGSSKMAGNIGGNDFWIVKLKADGTKEWDKTYGGDRDDILTTITITQDGGFLLGGLSESGVGNFKTEASKGNYDYWVIKLNKDGDKEWDKSFGTSQYDYLKSVTTTQDGGYLLGGHTLNGTSADKTDQGNGGFDYWVIKITADGSKVWDKTYGGSGDDLLKVIIPVASGGYLLGGSSHLGSGFDKSQQPIGTSDYWVIKIDENGKKLWDKTYGGDGFNVFMAMLEVPGGFLLAGHTEAGKGHDKSEASFGENDYWVVKLNEKGDKLWDKRFGGNLNEHVGALTSTKDGAFIVGGHSYSAISGHKSEANRGSADFWMVKFSAAGEKIWDKTIGGSDGDYLTSILSLANDTYLLGGMSLSGASKDKASTNLGYADYWVVKLDQSQPTTPAIPTETDKFCLPANFKIHPNPTTGSVWFTTSDDCLALPTFDLTIYNPVGQQLFHKKQLDSSEIVDIAGFANGLYLFVLTFADEQRVVKKMVKMN